MINMLLPLAGKLLDKVLPDPESQAKAKIELMKVVQSGELQLEENQLKRDLEQIALNKIEAGSDNLFKSGWRPAVG